MHSDKEVPATMSELMGLLEGIENYQFDEVLSVQSDNIYASTMTSERTPLETRKPTSLHPRRKRIRRVGSVPYSTDLQRRRRRELLLLRSEAQELESKLSQLQQQANTGETILSSQQSQPHWQRLATIRQDSEKAENENQKLKKTLSSHLNLFASIQMQLQRSDLLEGIQVLSQSSEALLTQHDTANSVLKNISGSLE